MKRCKNKSCRFFYRSTGDKCPVCGSKESETIEAQQQTPDKLQALLLFAAQLIEADKAVEAKEAELKTLAEKARRLREETIPEHMHELGILKIELGTGRKITIKQDVYASLPEPMREKAYDWLQEHGFGGLLKSTVAVEYTRGTIEEAEKLLDELRDRGIEATLTESVHPQTLKAWLREQLAAARNVPLETFGARPVWTTTIK